MQKQLKGIEVKGLLKAKPLSHEEFISEISAAAISRLNDGVLRKTLRTAKVTYGVGDPRARGVTYYSSWKNGEPKALPMITICANGEENPVQLAGTTIHELAHVLAEGDGHGKLWKQACEVLGLLNAEAAGMCYTHDTFSPDIKAKIIALWQPTDGKPLFSHALAARPCTRGIGTRGGKSRGAGSGSRLRLFECECKPAVKVRVSHDEFDATCNVCGCTFKRIEKD